MNSMTLPRWFGRRKKKNVRKGGLGNYDQCFASDDGDVNKTATRRSPSPKRTSKSTYDIPTYVRDNPLATSEATPLKSDVGNSHSVSERNLNHIGTPNWHHQRETKFEKDFERDISANGISNLRERVSRCRWRRLKLPERRQVLSEVLVQLACCSRPGLSGQHCSARYLGRAGREHWLRTHGPVTRLQETVCITERHFTAATAEMSSCLWRKCCKPCKCVPRARYLFQILMITDAQNNVFIHDPTLMAFTGATNAHGPSPQPTASRSPTCNLPTLKIK